MSIDNIRWHRAAELYGPLVSSGILSFGEALDSLMSTAIRDDADLDELDPLQSRLSRTLADAAMAAELAAARAIRDGIQPLLQRRAKSADIIAAAHGIARAALQPQEIEAIVREEISHALARLKARKRA